jgi:maltose alpha-D-glucosyltransferase/alpha-amylase
MSIKATSDLWWKNAIFYCLDVEMFYDVDGDGCGDLMGLTERIDYLAGLGVSCVWLMPFYPSPNRDDGYDIVDFYGIDKTYGTPGDFVELIRTCRDRGIRVIADFVMNHTSDQHPWFQSARSDPDSPYRDFYVWADERPPEKPGDLVFPDQETSNWAYDRKAQKYYLHKFYSHQPDLNLANPEVRDELAQVMGFWLEQGLSGFRVDAVPFLIEGAMEDPHQVLRDLRAYLSRRNGEAVLLGEVNLPPAEVRAFLGDEDGDELHMVLDFIGNQAMYLALARGEAEPLARALRDFPAIPPSASLGRFVRNHDELTLDKLTEEERSEVFARFGPEPDMQLYGRGLRRRLPPMLGNDARAIRMLYSLAFSLPGTPVLFYGEEIGMADNPAIEGRYAVRPPMQWSPDGGFSTVDGLRRPMVEGEYGPERVNVATQRREPDSLLNWF